MTSEAAVAKNLELLLLRLLSQPEVCDSPNLSARAPEEGATGEGATGDAGFVRAGALLALLGFDDTFEDADRDKMSEQCGRALLQRGLALLLRPVGRGGILGTLAACCVRAGKESAVGCAVVLPAPRQVGAGGPPDLEQQLFQEARGRYVLCIPAERQADARLLARDHGVPLWPLGRTGGRELVVRATGGSSEFQEVVRLPLLRIFEAVAAPST